ncbi:MAG: beta-lactamase family protein [Clostridia bacterium]|nr:beta-lactamase family protein [Clostridia bacterium]
MSDRVFVKKGFDAGKVQAFIAACAEDGINLRAMQIYKSGEPAVKVCMAPYRFDMPMHLYSLSKSFTSAAVGICCDAGLLSPDTVVSELMPERMPADLSADAKRIKIRDLLSMQSGHNECKLYKMRWADDAVKAFFEQPLTYEPGAKFTYNTGATCVCAACVEKVTGMKQVDFLYEKLFKKLGIKKPRWRETRDGTCLGGTGLYLSSDDITKFGLMLANGGAWNGERILSEEYIKLATQKHSQDSNNGSPDWVAGYGFQFWLNSRGGFRGDGAFGQLLLVFPERDIVMSFLSETGDMAKEMLHIYSLLDMVESGEGGLQELEEYANTRYLPALQEPFCSDVAYEVGENGIGLKKLRFYGENLLHAVLETDYGVHEFVCGKEDFILNHLVLRNLNPNIGFLDPDTGSLERVSVFAAYRDSAHGKTEGLRGKEIILRHADTCHVQRWFIENGKLHIRLFVGDLPEREFALTGIPAQAEQK